MSTLYQYPLLAYVIRMTLISGLCYGYYLLFLRNRHFHTYNRTYLLVSALLAFLVPLIHIPSPRLPAYAAENPVIMILTNSSPVPATEAAAPAVFSQTRLFLPGIYMLITTLLLFKLGRSIYLIIRLARRNPSRHLGGIRVFETSGTSAPFSFHNWLFWDPQMDHTHGQGRLIFLHESYHIRQRHTLDILGLELIKALCWFNPFFYLVAKELKTLHEFAADSYAISQKNTPDEQYDYAERLVWQSMGKPFPVTHSFYNPQLKRRIHMITQTSRRAGSLSRIMALPLLLLLTALFCASAAHTQSTADTLSNHRMLRWFNRHLRYPRENLSASKEGAIRFTVTMGDNGKLLGFSPLDQHTPEQSLQKITVTSRPDGKAGVQMPTEAAARHFMDDAKEAAEKINSPHPRFTYVDSVSAGQYYFEITYKIEK